MKYIEPNIVVVDDKKDEIKGIIDHYNELGLGCKYFNSDLYDGVEFPAKCYSDVMLLFLDLYYSESPFDAELCANWVQSIIPQKSFYVLVLWTRDSSNAEEVKEELKKNNRTPFCCIIKSKIDYQNGEEERYNYRRLFEDINNELDNVPALEEIQIWKKCTKLSSNEIIGHLTKESDPNKFNQKLKKIIISHGGTSIKTNNNFQHKRSILFDALDNILVSNTKKNTILEEISEVNKQNLYNLENFEDPGIDKELNSWFHFKLEKVLSPDLICPGLISEFLDNNWKRLYSIHDDNRIMEYMKFQIGETVRITSITLLISRPCDIAQNKYGKNLKLISGLKIVNPIRKDNPKKEFRKGLSEIDSIKIYDHLFFSEEEKDVALLFDFRYNFSVPSDIFITDFTNIKVFNKELLSEMQVEYSSYSSRLGITQVI